VRLAELKYLLSGNEPWWTCVVECFLCYSKKEEPEAEFEETADADQSSKKEPSLRKSAAVDR
jgi:hypothetical protein